METFRYALKASPWQKNLTLRTGLWADFVAYHCRHIQQWLWITWLLSGLTQNSRNVAVLMLFCKSLQTHISDELCRLFDFLLLHSSSICGCTVWLVLQTWQTQQRNFCPLSCYEINSSSPTLWPSGIASLLLIGYDLVFAWHGSFLVPSNWLFCSEGAEK